MLHLKGIAYQIDPIVPFFGDDRFSEISPLRRIPVYSDGKVTLCDSTVICEYLEDVHPAPALYPREPADRARARWLEEFADTRMGEVIIWRLFNQVAIKPRVFGVPTDEAVLRKTLDVELPHVLDYLESQLPAQGFLFGEIGVADIAIAAFFRNAAFSRYRVDAARWPRTAAFVERALAHDCLRRLVPFENASLKRAPARSSAPRSRPSARRSPRRRSARTRRRAAASCRSDACRQRPILVTGANGRLGRALCRRLAEASPPRRVRALVRSERAADALRRAAERMRVPRSRSSTTRRRLDRRAGRGLRRRRAPGRHPQGDAREPLCGRPRARVRRRSRPPPTAAGLRRIVALSILGADAALAQRVPRLARARRRDPARRGDAGRGDPRADGARRGRPRVGRARAPGARTARAARARRRHARAADRGARRGRRARRRRSTGRASTTACSSSPAPNRSRTARSSSARRAARARGVAIASVPAALAHAFAWIAERTSADPPITRAMLGVLEPTTRSTRSPRARSSASSSHRSTPRCARRCSRATRDEPQRSPRPPRAPGAAALAARAALARHARSASRWLGNRIAGAAARQGDVGDAYLMNVFASVSWDHWLALMIPYSAFFFLVDSTVVWRVVAGSTRACRGRRSCRSARAPTSSRS